MVNQENINLKLRVEMTEVEQEIQKKKKNKEDEQKNSTTYWRGFWSFLILSMFSSVGLTGNYGMGWQFGSIVCVFFTIICFCLGISSSGKVKKINKEIERLEKKKKELRNSIR